jgi:NodT family efflux transporter outer membrane factor (OMF) lipoprotein
MRRVLRIAAGGAIVAGLGACTVGPDFTPPKPPDVAAWNDRSAQAGDPGAAVAPQSNPDPKWWNGFNDPVLTGLMDKAIAGNLGLQQAVMRVIEARQQIVSASSAGLPHLNGTGSYTRQQLGLKGILESRGAYGELNGTGNQNSTINSLLGQITQPVDIYQYGFSASWELDLFGKVRRSVEQATAQTEAQVEATKDSLVMLESQVAQGYLQLRGAQALAASQQENIRTAQEALDLTQRRQQLGLATDLEVEQARTQLDDYQRQLPAYEKQLQQSMNSLSVLTGQPPGALDSMLSAEAPLPAIPQVVGIGIPSALARRRPDVREAEARLHAATANEGVAVANFYPDISLTGNLGLRATDASYLTNWASHFYSIGPSISLPIFQGGSLTASLSLARAEVGESALNYRQTVLDALREVEDALVAYRTDRAARDKLQDTVRSGELALYLARSQYVNGLANFIQFLDTQRTLTSSRQQLVQANVTLANDVVALYTALGGGWEDSASEMQAPPPIDPAPPIAPAALDSVAAGTRE